MTTFLVGENTFGAEIVPHGHHSRIRGLPSGSKASTTAAIALTCKEPAMPLYALGDKVPTISPEAFIAPDAVIIGDVTIGAESSIWPGAVLRGDHGAIRVGQQTSIQDGTIVHCTADADTIVGDRCVVGHNAHLEGCTVLDDSLIGSGSVILHHVKVGPHALVGAGAVVSNNTIVPPFARALGVPARVVENMVNAGDFTKAVDIYVRNSHWYRRDLRRLD